LSGSARGGLPAALAKEKLELALPVHGMAGNFFAPENATHRSLRIERVTDDAKLQAYADINSEAYGFPL